MDSPRRGLPRATVRIRLKMKKENKLLLRVVKTALKMAEAAKKMEESKLENKYGASRRPITYARAGCVIPGFSIPEPRKWQSGNDVFKEMIGKAYESAGVHRPNTDTTAEAPTGKKESTIEDFNTWLVNRHRPEKVLSRNERNLRAFAADELNYVEGLMQKSIVSAEADEKVPTFYEVLKNNGTTLVHVKSPELGTETLVVLSPEGEVLLRIVKDNSRKFAVK